VPSAATQALRTAQGESITPTRKGVRPVSRTAQPLQWPWTPLNPRRRRQHLLMNFLVCILWVRYRYAPWRLPCIFLLWMFRPTIKERALALALGERSIVRTAKPAVDISMIQRRHEDARRQTLSGRGPPAARPSLQPSTHSRPREKHAPTGEGVRFPHAGSSKPLVPSRPAG